MSRDARRTYLNDHLAGATLGRAHAEHLRQRYAGQPFEDEMSRIAREVGEDHDTLKALVERLPTSRNPIKEAGAWVAEKAGQAKFSAMGPGDDALGTFQALETMALGVAGKRALWAALVPVAADWPEVATLDLDDLLARAESQHAALDTERRRVGALALADDG